MRERLLRIIFMFVALCVAIFDVAAAKDVSFKVNVPLQVAAGEAFPVEFVLDASPDNDSFQAPAFSGLNVIAGPRISSGSSIQVINNTMTKSVNYTYTYVLMADSAGRYTIPAAQVKVDKKIYSTQRTVVEVVREQRSLSQSSSSQSGVGSQQQSPQSEATSRVGKDDVLLRLLLSSNEVYKGEPIRAVFKLFTRVDIVNYENFKAPVFNGFWAQEVTQPRRADSSRETYNGQVYDTYVIKEYLLYPQQSGEIEIESMQMDAVAQVVVQSRNIDPFFGRSNEFYNVRRSVATTPRTINVKRLPAGAPESYSGAVGEYQLELIPFESNIIEANSAKLLKLRVSGTGNLSFIQAPKLELPNSFEQYVVRTTESIQTTSQGATGYKEFEYPLIARAEGEYTIPAIEFSYFDPKTGAYTSLHTNPFSVTITPDKRQDGAAKMVRSGVDKADVALLGSDIRFIKLGEAKFTSKRDPLIGSPLYFVVLFVLIAIFVVVYIVARRMIRDARNQALRRGKRANKVVVHRFNKAKQHMDEGNERLFYDEVLHGMWGYMSDKLNIPVADLTKEYVRDELNKRNADGELVSGFADLITRCDEAHYSPMASAQMNEVYGCALHLVSQMEILFKR
ncbi:MAG: BatD family protein [Rikenellaceae bacterium]